MKTQGLNRYMTLMALLVLSAASVVASGLRPEVIANVPFAFVAADQQLPSGDYSIWRVTETWGGPLEIRNRNQGKAVMVPSHPMVREMTRDAVPKLIFHRYGDRYFLAEVWSGGTAGFDLPPSQEEREYVDSEVRYASVVIRGRSGR